MKWIPITYRKADEDERENGHDIMLDCPLPEEDEEVLICIRGSNRISVDTLVYDREGYYFDNEGDIESVSAWMPLPEAYEED